MNADEIFMKAAIAEAVKAESIDEVPIGAVAVAEEKIICAARNLREATGNPLGHAEILLIEKLVRSTSSPSPLVGEGRGEGGHPFAREKDWRLEDITIYVTCEPCIMCMGALLQARIPRIVFGCMDPKAGACGSLYNLAQDKRLNHQIEVSSGVLVDECSQLLKDFFKRLR